MDSVLLLCQQLVLGFPLGLYYMYCPYSPPSVVRRQWVVELLFVYQTSVFTLYTTERRSILLYYYYYYFYYCLNLRYSYTTLSFIRFANINVK